MKPTSLPRRDSFSVNLTLDFHFSSVGMSQTISRKIRVPASGRLESRYKVRVLPSVTFFHHNRSDLCLRISNTIPQLEKEIV